MLRQGTLYTEPRPQPLPTLTTHNTLSFSPAQGGHCQIRNPCQQLLVGSWPACVFPFHIDMDCIHAWCILLSFD